MNLNYEQIKIISKQYGDSFYILDSEKFKANYQELLDSFRSIYENTSIGYSYKTNYLPKLCSIVNQQNGYAEVVSQMELELALKIGVKPSKIIFNGPYKQYNDIKNSLLNGTRIHIDSLSELNTVIEIVEKFQDQNFKIGLRCNFQISNLKISRFGISEANGDLATAFKKVDKIVNLKVAGIHCHFPNRDLNSFEERVTKMLKIVNRYFNDDLEFIDVGGGFFSKMNDKLKSQFNSEIPSYKEYADIVATRIESEFSSLQKQEKPELIIEPGSAIVADTMYFLSEVVSIKNINNYKIATISGSKFNITPQNQNIYLPFKIITNSNISQTSSNYLIAGYTCIESDYLSQEYNGVINEGDFILFENVGSYSIVLKPPFIHTNSPVIELKPDNSIELLKVKEKTEHVFKTYKI
jgi:diaminopimelate decarboxylase